MANKPQYQPLSDFYEFPTFADPASVTKATGVAPPAFDPSKRIKRWVDPNPVDVGIESPDGLPQTMYTGIDPKTAASANPTLKKFMVTLEEATSFNIPEVGTGQTNYPGVNNVEVPTPMRDLLPTQKLAKFGALSILVVENLDAPKDPSAPTTEADVVALGAKVDAVTAALAAVGVKLDKIMKAGGIT